MRETDVYRCMFKDIIKCQIQALLDQLANAGEESVLLTSCIPDQPSPGHQSSPAEQTLGSDVGQTFIQQHQHVNDIFQKFCLKTGRRRDPVLPSWSKKRKYEELNDDTTEDGASIVKKEGDLVVMDTKRVKTDVPDTQHDGTKTSVATPSTPDSPVPKGHIQCSLCNYSSKFKNNVVRHERSRHNIYGNGNQAPSVEYACALCTYRSTYRSNVMRHEKNVHKLCSSAFDLENRKVLIGQSLSQPQFETWTENQSNLNDNQSSMFDTETNITETQSSIGDTECNMDDNGPNTAASHDGVGDINDDVQDVNGSNIAARFDDVGDINGDVDGENAGCNICSYCQEIFISITQLRTHIANAHFESGEFTCDKCGQSFSSLFLLHGHMTTHNSLKQEKCVCGKTFQYKTSLKRHQRRCEAVQENGVKIDGEDENRTSQQVENETSQQMENEASQQVENETSQQVENETSQGENEASQQVENETSQQVENETNQGENEASQQVESKTTQEGDNETSQ